MRKKLIEITDEQQQAYWLHHFNHHDITADEWDQFTQHQYAQNSLLAMRNDWHLFRQFCQARNVQALPCASTAVRLFIQHEAKVRKYATLRRYVLTIGLIHRILVQKDPTTNVTVKTAISEQRINKHGDASQAAPFNQHHMVALDHALSASEHIRDWRNLAICYVMFECALKRSEVRQLTIEQLQPSEYGLILQLGDQHYRFSDAAQQALQKWLAHLPDSHTPLFRAIDRHGNIGSDWMDHSSLYRVIRSVSEIIGVNVQFSGQSMRVGAVQELAKSGLKVREIQTFGRWLSPAMPYQYVGNKAAAEAEKMTYVAFKPLE